ncbi:MAG: zinc carboxypeptidase [Candidatus Riflebacteria bacterium]|nr:zinc carboxypeptidase [Candidatus Riflebacteria bacterium]
MIRLGMGCVALLTLMVSIESAWAKGPRIVKIPAATAAERAQIVKWGVEVIEVRKDSITVAIPQEGKLQTKVARAAARYPGAEVMVEDADDLFSRFAAQPDLGAYHNLPEIKDELNGLAGRFPQIASVHSIGKTVEGRDTLALRITGPDAAPWGRPVFLFMGAHHAREWISVEVPLAIGKWLCEGYATDPAVKSLVDAREIWILPAVNPDGLNYSQTQSKYWRKNRRKNADGSYGVDPNRNYGYKWGTAGDSGYPGSDVYRGTEAMSEPETRNVGEFAVAHHLTASISYHSYGDKVMHPWSYTYDTSPDKEVFSKLAQGMAGLNGYSPIQSSELYPSSGDTDDYLYGTHGACSFTYELAQSFIPAESEIPEICSKNVKAAQYLLENAAEVFPVLTHTPPAGAAAGPLPIGATFDRAHHPDFQPVEVKLIVVSGATAQETVMTPDPANPDQFTAELALAGADGQPVEYFFGLKDKDGKLARCPRLSNFSVTAGATPPPTLLMGPVAGR